MSKRFARAAGVLATTAAVSVGGLVAAASATAVTTGIRKPSLTVVCAQPHRGSHFSAVRFRQQGGWAAGASVVVTLTRGNGNRAKAQMHAKGRADGSFRLRRTLHSSSSGPWIAGATYGWTTELSGKDWAMARRGTVILTGSC